jgi:hypothetical protein
VLGKSADRTLVFGAIYTGKKRAKTVTALAKATGLPRKRVLEEGKRLEANNIVDQVKENGEVAYRKIDFFHSHKKRILALAASKKKLKAYPTKRNPSGSASALVQLRVSPDRAKTKPITIDDIESFRLAWSVSVDTPIPPSVSEKRFKAGIQRILGQLGQFKDWGGETSDLFSTKVRIDGNRRWTAFAFKGPATKGSLTPSKMGKNGDQIQRLFEAPAQVHIVQYHGTIDASVLKQMTLLAVTKSLMTGQLIYYGVIDGEDSHRLLIAYSNRFKA